MVNVPERAVVLVLAATEYDTVPVPVPLLEVVIQEGLLDAVQVQPVPAVTLTLPLPAAEVVEALAGEIE